MDGAGLSDHEQRILSEIESELRGDPALERRLRTMRWGCSLPHPATRMFRLNGLVLAVLGLVSVTLLIAAAATTVPLLIWAFAAAWGLTVLVALRLTVRWSRRLRGGGGHGGGGHGGGGHGA
jgi:hypothetical protein